MKQAFFFRSAFIVTLATTIASAALASPPNVLFIMVDDLRAELGCYGTAHVISPNIDKLAANGILFERAYCQQAICNPSRTSLLTGRRPDSTGIYGNATHFRDRFPDAVTLPQFFKQQGYHTQACGKIYHGVFLDGVSNSRGDMFGDPPSWSVPAFRPGPRYYYTESGADQAREAYKRMYRVAEPGPDDWTRKLCFGPMTEAPEVSDNTLYDGQVADKAIHVLRELADDKAVKQAPFFLAVGFIKPHTPFVAPKKYWDLYDPEHLPAIGRETLPDDCPSVAGQGSHEIRRYTDQPKRGAFTEDNKRRLRHGYFACISYIDAQLGRVLDELDRLGLRETTIVSFVGDHGYHLGDYGMWGKTTNFERGTRVPFIVSMPSGSDAPTGKRAHGLAELVDLYPTLLDLAGFEVPEALEGDSLKEQVLDPASAGQPVARSQYPRGKLMGRSIRTDRYRYTEWQEKTTGAIAERELYDYQTYPEEGPNLASRPEFAAVVSLQAEQMKAVWPRPAVPVQVSTPGAGGIGFENFPAGGFEKLDSKTAGTWTAPKGQAEIDPKHAHTGKQCLHLFGGEDGKGSSVVWNAPDEISPDSLVRFQAERWTKRVPFSFRIDAQGKKGVWHEVFNGDKAVVVGRAFLSEVEFLQPFATKALRFRCVSPPNTGILIDDLSTAKPEPMQITGVRARQALNPVLIGKQDNPVIHLEIDTKGQLLAPTVSSVSTKLAGTIKAGEVQAVELRAGGRGGEVLASASPNEDGSVRLKPDTELKLKSGTSSLKLCVVLQSEADWEKRIDLSGTTLHLKTAGSKEPTTQKLPDPAGDNRIGIALRTAGQEGVHTYRIPGIATTPKGTLVAAYDLRRRAGGDLPGDIDVAIQTSSDQGRTWSPMKIVMDMGDDPAWRFDGVGDPTVLVDDKRGTIWVAATWSHGNRSWHGSGPGLEPEETGQFMLVKSEDEGRTWSEPINITKQIKDPAWHFVLQGPGRGITLRDGTLVMPAQFKDEVKMPHSTIIYSSDGGESWQIGTGVKSNTTEAQVVELADGSVMINCRDNRGGSRSVYTTTDLGKTWNVHPSSRSALPEPVCNAGLLRHRDKLFFSNPPQTRGRNHMTVKVSSDEGMTWPEKWHTLIDERSTAYSIMTDAGPDHIGLLYEGPRELYYLRLPIAELMKP